MGEVESVLSIVGDLGIVGLLAALAYALHKQWLVHGRELRRAEAEAERERAERIKAEDRLDVADANLLAAREQLARATALAEVLADKVPQPNKHGENRR